jgi:hypothetical protein
MKKCFVISPIGPEDSEIRKEADEVFDYIIKPAMNECNIDPFRSDHLDKPGRISEQMFRAIHEADLCIAVLTGHNPNVFYELAVAQSANRPVIILMKKGQQLPFDVSDLRCVYYALDIRTYNERTDINRVVNYVREFEAANWIAQDLFQAYRPRVKTAENEVEFFETTSDFGDDKEWLQLLQDTCNCFDIMGIGLMSWRKNENFKDIIQTKLNTGCKVRILLMHQDHPQLSEIAADPKSMKLTIPQNYSFFKSISGNNENIEVRQMLKGIPHLGLTVTDRHAISIQYMQSKKWGSNVLLKCPHTSGLYSTLKKEFDVFWEMNDPLKLLLE